MQVLTKMPGGTAVNDYKKLFFMFCKYTDGIYLKPGYL